MKQEMKEGKNTVLVVDDLAENIEILEEILENEFQVKSATSGEEAIQTALRFEPDIVLLDIMMPGIDGYEVCRRLRRSETLAFTKIIMLSAKGMPEERIAGYDAGADDYVVKPFDEDELLSKMDVFLRLKRCEETDALKESLIDVLGRGDSAPLAGIIGGAKSVMLEKSMTDECRMKHGDLILRRVEDLRAFIESAIKAISIASGVVKLDLGRFELSSIVRGAMKAASDAGGAGGGLEPSSDASITVLADERRLEEALRTLLEAANETGAVKPVGVTRRNGWGVVTINGWSVLGGADGGGTVKSLRSVLESASAYEECSTLTEGLRIAVANEVIRCHGGRLSVGQAGLNETAFLVELPIAE